VNRLPLVCWFSWDGHRPHETAIPCQPAEVMAGHPVRFPISGTGPLGGDPADNKASRRAAGPARSLCPARPIYARVSGFQGLYSTMARREKAGHCLAEIRAPETSTSRSSKPRRLGPAPSGRVSGALVTHTPWQTLGRTNTVASNASIEKQPATSLSSRPYQASNGQRHGSSAADLPAAVGAVRLHLDHRNTDIGPDQRLIFERPVWRCFLSFVHA